MKKIATDMVLSVGEGLNKQHQEYCFEIFGLDFMIDQKFKPYLIEANSNPCITVEGAVLTKIIPNMLENAMRIAIDPVFPPPLMDIARGRYPFSNHFESNKFVLIYDSYHEGRGCKGQ